MPRHNRTAAEELGERLTQLHTKREKQAGQPISWERISQDIAIQTGQHVIKENVRKAHLGLSDPNKCALDDLLLLARYYGVAPSALGDVVKRRVENLLAACAPGPRDTGGDLPDDASRSMRDDASSRPLLVSVA